MKKLWMALALVVLTATGIVAGPSADKKYTIELDDSTLFIPYSQYTRFLVANPDGDTTVFSSIGVIVQNSAGDASTYGPTGITFPASAKAFVIALDTLGLGKSADLRRASLLFIDSLGETIIQVDTVVNGNLALIMSSDGGVTWDTAYTGSAGGGVTDHGALTGLGDDDHPQYGALAQAEVLTGNWDNTANPWADDEIASSATWNATANAFDSNYIYLNIDSVLEADTVKVPGQMLIGGVASSSLKLHVYDGSANVGIQVQTGAVDGAASIGLQNDVQQWTVRTNTDDDFHIRNESAGGSVPFSINPTTNDITITGSLLMQATETVDGVDVSALDADVAADSTSWNAAADDFATNGSHTTAGYLTGISGQQIGDLGDVTETGIADNIPLVGNALGTWGPGSIAQQYIINPAWDSTHVADGGLNTEDYAVGSVTEPIIGTGAVTANKIGSGVVSRVKMATDAWRDSSLVSVTWAGKGDPAALGDARWINDSQLIAIGKTVGVDNLWAYFQPMANTRVERRDTVENGSFTPVGTWDLSGATVTLPDSSVLEANLETAIWDSIRVGYTATATLNDIFAHAAREYFDTTTAHPTDSLVVVFSDSTGDVDWDNISNMPAGFSDGVDNTISEDVFVQGQLTVSGNIDQYHRFKEWSVDNIIVDTIANNFMRPPTYVSDSFQMLHSGITYIPGGADDNNSGLWFYGSKHAAAADEQTYLYTMPTEYGIDSLLGSSAVWEELVDTTGATVSNPIVSETLWDTTRGANCYFSWADSAFGGHLSDPFFFTMKDGTPASINRVTFTTWWDSSGTTVERSIWRLYVNKWDGIDFSDTTLLADGAFNANTALTPSWRSVTYLSPSVVPEDGGWTLWFVSDTIMPSSTHRVMMLSGSTLEADSLSVPDWATDTLRFGSQVAGDYIDVGYLPDFLPATGLRWWHTTFGSFGNGFYWMTGNDQGFDSMYIAFSRDRLDWSNKRVILRRTGAWGPDANSKIYTARPLTIQTDDGFYWKLAVSGDSAGGNWRTMLVDLRFSVPNPGDVGQWYDCKDVPYQLSTDPEDSIFTTPPKFYVDGDGVQWGAIHYATDITVNAGDSLGWLFVVPHHGDIDSLRFILKDDGGTSVVDSISIRGPDGSTGLLIATDSTYWGSGTDQSGNSATLITVDVTDITVTPGQRYMVTMVSKFAADNDSLWIGVPQVRLK